MTEMAAELSEEGLAAWSGRAARIGTKALSHHGAGVGLAPGLTAVSVEGTRPQPRRCLARGGLVGVWGHRPEGAPTLGCSREERKLL